MRRAMSYFWKIGLILMAVGLILSVTAFGIGASKGRRAFGASVELEEAVYKEDIRGLEIEIEVGTVRVRRGESFSVSGSRTERQKLIQEVDDGVLLIKEENNGNHRGIWPLFGVWPDEWDERAQVGLDIIVTIPEGVSLEELEVSNGLGEVILEGLAVTGETSIRTGAGEVNLRDFDGKGELSLDCGLGQISGQGSFSGESRLKCGTGEIYFQGEFEGRSDIECGIGSIRMDIDGSEADYGYELEGGIGTVQVGSRSYGGIGTSDQIIRREAENQLEIQCGIGEVLINFGRDD